MILEYAQLMSTAHRILDGEQYQEIQNGRRLMRWGLIDYRNATLYKASHVNHPSAVWVRQNVDHYIWLFQMWKELLKEYTHRYERWHKTSELYKPLYYAPNNIPKNQEWQDPPPAMPDECKIAGDSIASYRNYYVTKKKTFATWKNRDVPEWYESRVSENL